MIFAAIAAVIPVKSSAAYSSMVSSDNTYTSDEIKEIVNAALEYDFESAADMLNYELEHKYLDSVNSVGNKYSIYVNRYTGVLYYVNNATGEILTSNPYNLAYKSGTGKITVSEPLRNQLLSQIVINYTLASDTSKTEWLYSASASAANAQIKVSPILNGLRVSYTLGDTSARYLVPGQITEEKFESLFLNAALADFADKLERYLGDVYPDEVFDFYGRDTWGEKDDPVMLYGCVNPAALKAYRESMKTLYSGLSRQEKKVLDNVSNDINTFRNMYTLNNPAQFADSPAILEGMYSTAPLTEQGIAVASFSGTADGHKKTVANLIKKYAPDYTFQNMYADEEECMFDPEIDQKPVFRCALEYTFNQDGSLSVRLPSSSIVFDQAVYNLKSISSLKFFGCGDLGTDGYVFLPDGSGAIAEFGDFYDPSKSMRPILEDNLSIYGSDYCYSKISGAHREHVSMPVYGLVSETTASPYTYGLTGKETVDTGYFAIIESGASLASLQMYFGGTQYKYGTVYSLFSPYPSDEFDISDTISVGGSGKYTIVSESKFTGSYITRYVMLSDPEVAVMANVEEFYPATYVGMATYYRHYLIDRGELTALENVSDDLPLYIEALGSMEIIKKILTFPVSVSIPLTTFSDVVAMYDQLADAKQKFYDKYEEYTALAEAEEKSQTLKDKYESKATEYYALYEKVEGITNVNFRLTGFANEGMYFTYPTRVKWEKALGGKAGFDQLLLDADERVDNGGRFGIFPEFDFLYINYTSAFDGISNRNNVSRMVDNRYASKQVYNSVLMEYESLFAMVISSDALDRLYDKFDRVYSQSGASGISVSTLGSDINSNFDDENPINRDESQGYVEELLDRISSSYEVMVNKGNAYSLKYADHIVDISIDSSHMRDTSFSIPFTGLVLHGYVNYAGNALNYTGSPKYDILHSIENGASLYYILCYQNTNFMKDDVILNKYYGVNFDTWFDSIVDQYDTLNDYIGELQSYEIVDHETFIVERVIDAKEVIANNNLLMDEFCQLIRDQLDDAVDAAFDKLFAEGSTGKMVKVIVDVDALLDQAESELNITKSDLIATDFDERLAAIKAEYEESFSGEESVSTPEEVYFTAVSDYDLVSKYNFVTDSYGDDEDYDHTDYTIDNNLVAMVTYRDPNDHSKIVKFILNYNVYKVSVKLSDGTSCELDKYDVHMIDLRGA